MKRNSMRCLSMILCFTLIVAMRGTAMAEGYALVIPPKYDRACGFSEGLAAVLVEDRWGFIDKMGKEIVPPKYQDAGAFSEGLAAVCVGEDWKTGKWGYIDKAGNEVIPPKYDYANDFREGMALIELDSKYGFIDMNGNEIVPPKYDGAEGFHDGLALVGVGGEGGVRLVAADRSVFLGAGEWGYVNKAGEEIVPVIYDYIGAFSEDRACVVKDGLMGFVDQSGAVVIPLTYKDERPFIGIYSGYEDPMPFFSEGLAAIWGGDERGGKYGYIDKDGNVAIPFVHDYAGPFSEGLAYVSKDASIWYADTYEDGHFGYIDKTGRLIVPLEYDCDYVGQGTLLDWRFVDGLAQVSKGPLGDMKYGLIDRTGKSVVPMRYHWMRRLDGGLSFAGYGGDYSGHGTWDSIGLVDKTGREIVPIDHYAWIRDFFEGYAVVRSGGEAGIGMESEESRYGFIDMAGNEVVACVFESAGNFSEGMAAIQRDGKWGYIAVNQ